MIDFKGSQFEKGIILWGIRWYVAYPISYRQLEEMMKERGVEVDHSGGVRPNPIFFRHPKSRPLMMASRSMACPPWKV